MKKPVRLLAACLALACTTATLAAPPASDTVLHLAQLSDVHDGGTHYSESDTTAAFTDALAENPQGLIMTGDFNDNSHDQGSFYQRFGEGLSRIAARLKGYGGPIFFAVGNDDVGHNYQSNPELLAQTYATFKRELGPLYYLDEMGNGVSPSHLGGLTWVTINSVIFYPRDQYPQQPQQAARVLDWLEAQLKAQPALTPVVLMMHVPPTFDDFSHATSWRTPYLHRFLQIVRAYPGQMVILAAHYHRNQVFRLARRQGDVPVLTCGAIAHKYGYASNWRSYTWHLGDNGKRFDELDYTLHYPKHPEWTDSYSIVPSQLHSFMSEVLHNHALTLQYLSDIWGHHEDAAKLARDRDEREKLRDSFNVEE